jgi:ubiquitin-like protein ATG12
LGLAEHEGVFCYVNSVFAPGLDEGVGNLWRVSSIFIPLFFVCIVIWTRLLTFFLQCFKTGEELVVSYSVTQAFG